jgi:hypothetical protein
MQLIGQGVDLATATCITVPTGSTALPGASTNPDLDSTAGNTVTLGQNNKIRGLNLRNSAGIDLVGTNRAPTTSTSPNRHRTTVDFHRHTAATFNVINSTSVLWQVAVRRCWHHDRHGGTTITNATTRAFWPNDDQCRFWEHGVTEAPTALACKTTRLVRSLERSRFRAGPYRLPSFGRPVL